MFAESSLRKVSASTCFVETNAFAELAELSCKANVISALFVPSIFVTII